MLERTSLYWPVRWTQNTAYPPTTCVDGDLVCPALGLSIGQEIELGLMVFK